jgi:putative GTP pyrophosphokinase
VGVRVNLLFRQDLQKVGSILRETFNVTSEEDAGRRLSEVQFGYQSTHYVVGLKPDWLQIPTLRDLGGLKVEIQVRTLAQHIWAAASHKLQYNREESVPPPLRRTIHRVSALLETADLELERALDDREAYIHEAVESAKPAEVLNVDLLESILSESFPEENKVSFEQYANVLEELFAMGITTAAQLRELIARQMKHVKACEKDSLEEARSKERSGSTKSRFGRSVYFTHAGMLRVALAGELGKKYAPYLNAMDGRR